MSAIDEAADRQEVVKEFAIETTMHGLKFLYARGIARKVIWTILLIGSCALVYVQVYQQFVKYFAHEISTQIDINYPSSLAFPSVMICNSNVFRIGKVYKYDESMYDMITTVFNSKRSEDNRFTAPDLKNYSQLLANLAKDSRYGRYDGNTTVFVKNFGHQIEDMLMGCTTANGSSCSEKDFTVQMTEIGPCYVLNMTMNITQAGPANALTLYINLQAYQSMSGPSELSSLKVLVYGNNDYPVVSNNAIDVAPGYMSVIGMKYHQEQRIASCIQPVKTKHFTQAQYSAATCQLDQAFLGIEKMCNCSPPYAPITNVSACQIDKYFNCALFFDASSFLNNITCTESCYTAGYATTLSLAKISTNIQKKLEADQKDSLMADYGDAMEAVSRKDPTDVARLNGLIYIWMDQVQAAKNFGLWPDAQQKSTLAISDRFAKNSTTFSTFAANFSLLMTLSATSRWSIQPPDNTCHDTSSPPTQGPSSGSSASVVNDSYLENSFQSVMSVTQQKIFNLNLSANINISKAIFNGWSIWKDLLANPCPYRYTPDNIDFFDNIVKDMDDYRNKQRTKLQWAVNQAKYAANFLSTFDTVYSSYISTLMIFNNTLAGLLTDDVTQLVFSHLDESVEDSQFWLAVNFASSAVFLQSFVNTTSCSIISNKVANTFDKCFTNSTSCSNCTDQSSEGPPQSGRRKRQGSSPPNGVGGNSNNNGGSPGNNGNSGGSPGGVATGPICCNMQIPQYNYYYWSFFKSLKENLNVLMKETNDFLNATMDMSNKVQESFMNLSNELSTYSSEFNLGSDFYSANFLGVQIYFSELSVQMISQSLPYDFFSLVCDIGGSLGLFLGASILTFFEIIDMVIFGICYHTVNRVEITKT